MPNGQKRTRYGSGIYSPARRSWNWIPKRWKLSGQVRWSIRKNRLQIWSCHPNYHPHNPYKKISRNTFKDTDYNPNRKVDPKDLPPAVFMLYGMNKPLPKVKMLGSFQVSPGIRAEARKPSGISFDDMLQQVFMPSARYKRKNAQRWRTQKYYNNYP